MSATNLTKSLVMDAIGTAFHDPSLAAHIMEDAAKVALQSPAQFVAFHLKWGETLSFVMVGRIGICAGNAEWDVSTCDTPPHEYSRLSSGGALDILTRIHGRTTHKIPPPENCASELVSAH